MCEHCDPAERTNTLQEHGFANGTDILAIIPRMIAGEIAYWVVLVRRSDDHAYQYVTATMTDLTDRSWNNGNYFQTMDGALLDAYARAGINPVPVG
jgi:hypothetical protein